MRVHILFPIRDTPSGGGNQFLLALRQRFVDLGCCAEKAEDADVILFNSYPFGVATQLYSQVASIRRHSKKNKNESNLIEALHLVRARN
jgi:hypothetical protein